MMKVIIRKKPNTKGYEDTDGLRYEILIKTKEPFTEPLNGVMNRAYIYHRRKRQAYSRCVITEGKAKEYLNLLQDSIALYKENTQ